MGPWADVIVTAAGLLAAFLAVMAFRGLAAVNGPSARCTACGKTGVLPLPAGGQRCWHCRHPNAHPPHQRHRDPADH